MSYTALYRKYRPSVFEDVKGQDHIVTTLKNQIKADRIGHAYLFCGTRGTGKTTIAKIYAKAVNCEHPVDGSPCGECAVCRAIADGSSMNVIEIDAASNNGVDNIRQIREEVAYPPTEGRFKVYIIDEVHMLSAGAFNALLKTLEEPPAYVIFILATTEAQKIPITILSRCQRYDFHRISIETITDRLRDLMAEEGQDVEDRALGYIAKAADGSMRDALSLLDQSISFYLGQKLTYENVLEVLGAVDTEVFSRLLRRIIADDVPGAVAAIEDLIRQGRELSQFVTDFIWYLRNLLLVHTSDDMEDVLDISSENLSLLKEEAAQLDEAVIMRYIRVFSELSDEMRYASQKRVLLEIAIIKLCRPQMEEGQDALSNRVANLERKVAQGVHIAPAGAPVHAAQVSAKKEEPKILPSAIPEDVKAIVSDWRGLIGAMSGLLKGYLQTARLSLGGDNKLMLVFDDEVAYTYVSENGHKAEIETSLGEQTGKAVEILVKMQEAGQAFEDHFVDLQKLIHMDIEIED